MAFVTPADANYTSWRGAFHDELSSHCGAWQFSVPDLLIGGRGLFQGFGKATASRGLQDVLASEPGGSVGHYLGYRKVALFIFILGVILFLISIIFAFALKTSFRDSIGRLFCGLCGAEPRRRHRGVERHHRHGLTTINIFFGLIALSGLLLLSISGGNLITGGSQASCNAWMHMYGHYFGTDDLSAGKLNDIVVNWGGTNSILEQVAALEHDLTPGPQNPTYIAFKDGLEKVKDSLLSQSVNLNNTAQEAMAMSRAHVAALRKLDFSQKQLARAVLVQSKTTEFLENLMATMNKSFEVLADAVEKLVGKDAPLLVAATDGLVKTKSTIGGIDASLAAVTRTWRDISTLWKTVIILLACLAFLVSAGAFAALIVLTVAGIRLLRVPEDFTEPHNDRKIWGWTYGLMCVMAGVSALVCGVMFLVTSIGADACNTLQEGIFTRGDWSLLGHDILYPMEQMPVDMSTVFDSCVKSDGEGNVIASLGLDRPVAILSDAIDEAHVQIKGIQKSLVNEQEALNRVALLGTTWRDVLSSHYRPLDGNDNKAIYFNETRQLALDITDYNDVGSNDFLCLVPQYNQHNVLMVAASCSELLAKIAPFNQGIELLNEAALWIHSVKHDAAMPNAWCTSTLAKLGHECGRWPKSTTTYISGATTDADITAWVKNINEDVGKSRFKQYDRVQERVTSLIKELQLIETLATTTGDKFIVADGLICPDATSTECTYNDIRLKDIDRFKALARRLQDEFGTFLEGVGGYVDDLLLPTLDSFISDATAITDHGNCQFQGTALQKAAAEAMCETTMPAIGMCMVWSAIVSVACFILSVHSWGWYHYFADLRLHEGSSFEAMSSAKEYVAYTGYPSSAAHRGHEGSSPMMQQTGMHVSVMPSESLVSSSYVTCDVDDAQRRGSSLEDP